MKITDLESWLEAERHYRQLRLYNTIFMNWAKSMNVPTLFSWSSGIVLLFYVTFRPSGLPFLVYIWFPPVAVVSMFIITFLCYDAVVAKRVADEAMEKLESRTASYFHRLPPAEKLFVTKRARALQPVYLALGEFAEITLDVPINVWDEVINQVLFLLSL